MRIEEESASFLKKRSKKLSVLRALATASTTPTGAGVFCHFLRK
jgi:hypothetical protein